MGDFNFIRSTQNRNLPGGDMNDIMVFNELISNIDLQELPLKGRTYTWSNMQSQPLLQQLDWFFTSPSWTVLYPNTMVTALSKCISDHTPYPSETTVPKTDIFRFENFWVELPGFIEVVKLFWDIPVRADSQGKIINGKFKNLRRGLKIWSKRLSNLNTLIGNSHEAIDFLDNIEEQRPLFIHEWNFRNIVKNHILKLLHYRNIFWKKRCTMRWVKFGDENTKFFHASATQRYRQNKISHLTLNDGTIITSHQEKAHAFLNFYKGRMGTSEGIQMAINLTELITPLAGLENLSNMPSRQELESIMKAMPIDKAPGPDGFNGMFMKKCWNIIAEDFYKLAREFFGLQSSIQNLNISFICLIPKKSSPETANDYRPISVQNMSIKFLSKILAERLQAVILDLHENQYGFIKQRTIQDCLAWTFEFLHQCHQSKKQIVILKIDFEKAFDSVEHSSILAVLKAKGFNETWLKWISDLLTTSSSAVLLNGIPGKNFKCQKGVKQGDPISPLLFVLTADLLQSMINKAHDMGILSKPIPRPDTKFPIIQYADDTLIIMKACQKEIFSLKGILQSFASSTGLRINFHKSCMIPINVPEEKTEILAGTFGCNIGSLPFTYLGLPVGTTRPKIIDFVPLIDRVERRLPAITMFLNQGQRLTMVNSVLSSLPTYYMCTLKIPKKVIEHIDRARRHCLWRKSNEVDARSLSLEAWDKVCKPKHRGGLGIINLEFQNCALLMKHLDKFYNKRGLP